MEKKGLRFAFLLSLVFAFLFIFSGIASASLISVSPSSLTGETGKYQIYNISVADTNTPPGINITQVVIQIDSTASIGNKGNGTSAVGDYSYSLSSGYPSLSWNNSAGLVENGTSEYFWFNASLSRYAYYTLNVYELDNLGNQNMTSIKITSNDTIPPAVSFVSPPTPSENAVLNQSYIPVKVSASDFGSGLGNITIYLYNSSSEIVNKVKNQSSPFFYNFTGLPDGKYTVGVLATDLAGNPNSSSVFAVTLSTKAEKPNPNPSCSENWTCSWGSCINGIRTQRCIDLSGCNSTVLDNQTSSCDASSSVCSPLLNCTAWLPACGQGVKEQIKTCIDLNNCTSPSTTKRNCTETKVNVTNSSETPRTPIFNFNIGHVSSSIIAFSAVVGFIVIVIIVLVVIIRKLRRS